MHVTTINLVKCALRKSSGLSRSFYVGDAAGRLNDHSDADIRFAQVIFSWFLYSFLNIVNFNIHFTIQLPRALVYLPVILLEKD